ncbi:uncharacterized protein LOC111245736 [Varroa destructor]|uniref:Uncharacterized protein n=1 Tax=Varroa destructor TaxID=109461 RepID=A0A7M7JDC4_VARDE|nr:uncharacterized protein LOC111245736 [Varroa destructor]
MSVLWDDTARSRSHHHHHQTEALRSVGNRNKPPSSESQLEGSPAIQNADQRRPIVASFIDDERDLRRTERSLLSSGSSRTTTAIQMRLHRIVHCTHMQPHQNITCLPSLLLTFPVDAYLPSHSFRHYY